jgi:hypothetical protein
MDQQVEFYEEEIKYNKKDNSLSLISRTLINSHVAKDEHGVKIILIVCMVVCFLLTGILLWMTYGPSNGGQHTPPLPAQYPIAP